jgi:hydrogenase maturation factor HypF (carbamoyltransferase family)
MRIIEGQLSTWSKGGSYMKFEISPWGYVYADLFTCDKCGTPMHDDHDRRSGITIYACFKCGNRFYPDYPKTPGNNLMSCREVEDLAA